MITECHGDRNTPSVAGSAESSNSDEPQPRIRPDTWKRATPDDAVLSELRRVAALPLTGSLHDTYRSNGSVGSGWIIQTFGTWVPVCRSAGVEVEERTRGYRRGWTGEDLLDWARGYLEEAGAAPSAATTRNRLRKRATGRATRDSWKGLEPPRWAQWTRGASRDQKSRTTAYRGGSHSAHSRRLPEPRRRSALGTPRR